MVESLYHIYLLTPLAPYAPIATNPPPFGRRHMHLYSSERPQITTDRPALLLDGSAVPHLSVMPEPSGLMAISVYLRNYSSGESYSYSLHQTRRLSAELGQFFWDYYNDPESDIGDVTSLGNHNHQSKDQSESSLPDPQLQSYLDLA